MPAPGLEQGEEGFSEDKFSQVSAGGEGHQADVEGEALFHSLLPQILMEPSHGPGTVPAAEENALDGPHGLCPHTGFGLGSSPPSTTAQLVTPSHSYAC